MASVDTYSRTHNTMRNSLIGMLYYLLSIILNFISRNVFLNHLGVEVLGLNTTAGNLLSFLNLAELGIGFAIAYALYKPLAEKDYDKINEIITLQGMMYRRIAILIIFGAIILSCFFPIIFSKMRLPLWYAYASFGVLLFSSLLTYFINYREIILSANQQEYKITLSYRVIMLAKVVIQIIVISIMPWGYLWWLITEVIFAIISSIVLNKVIRKAHPYLYNSSPPYKQLKQKFPHIVKRVKQLFFHKIASFAVLQTSPLIIYAFLNLTMVAYYGNYLIIVSGISVMLMSLFNGANASVGNLIAEGNKEKTLSVFNELFCLRFMLTMEACICLYYLSAPFITLWIGADYVLPATTVALIVVNMYFSLSRGTVDTFLNGYGLFQDIWAPIAEAFINLGASIIGGWLWGLNGIIGGAIISQIIILFIWKPYFLFRYGFKTSIIPYVKQYFLCLLAGVVGLITARIINYYVIPTHLNDISGFLLSAIAYLLIPTIGILLMQVILTSPTRRMLARLLLTSVRQ